METVRCYCTQLTTDAIIASTSCHGPRSDNIHPNRVVRASTVPSSQPSSRSSLPPCEPHTIRDLVTLTLAQHIAVLLQRAPDELGLLPQIGRQKAIGVDHSAERRLERVLERLGRAGRGRVDVVDAGELQQALDGGRGDEAGAAGRGDQLVTIVSINLHNRGGNSAGCHGHLSRFCNSP